MYKTFLLLGTLLFGVSSSLLRGTTEQISTEAFLTNCDEWSQFTNFQTRFGKTYNSFEEMQDRFAIFRSNLKEIINHNLNNTHTYTLGINQFTDLTAEEFKDTYINGLSSEYSQDMKLFGSTTKCGSFSGSDGSSPSSIDWRQKNAVSDVKNQGQCGSCWSFSASGAMEGAWAIRHGKLYNLSEQQLVDCAGLAYGSMGCKGGQMDGAFKYATDKEGMCDEESYPYKSGTTLKSGNCEPCKPVVQVNGCMDVSPDNQKVLKDAVAKGPVSVAIEADTKIFQLYSSGILTSTSCGTNLDHGVLIVGYGTESGQDYWIVKNSWSNTWGEEGYIRIARSDSTSDPGICGIAMQPSFPVVV